MKQVPKTLIFSLIFIIFVKSYVIIAEQIDDMTKKQAIQLFEERKVRTIWDDEHEKWYFSIVDVVAVLTEQSDMLKARKYWNKLKQRLLEEGNQTVTNCHLM